MNETVRDHADFENVPNSGCFHIRNEIQDRTRGSQVTSRLVVDVEMLREGLSRLMVIDPNVTLRQWELLLTFLEHGDWVPVDFKGHWSIVPPSTMSRMLAQLAGFPMHNNNKPRPAWIELKPDPDDRRKSLARLLDARRNTLERALAGSSIEEDDGDLGTLL